MAAGLPVILCHTTTSTEVLEDGKTALFVDPISPEQIAEKVKHLIDNPADYFRIASAGQKFVKENMSWEKFAEETLRAFGKKNKERLAHLARISLKCALGSRRNLCGWDDAFIKKEAGIVAYGTKFVVPMPEVEIVQV